MSLLLCCTGRKRHSHVKTALKAPPPSDRDSRPAETARTKEVLPKAPSLTSYEKQQSLHNTTNFDETLSVKTSLVSNNFSNNVHSRDAKSISSDASSGNDEKTSKMSNNLAHASLDHILAHLLNDISSPSFQRSSNVGLSKTDENMNFNEAVELISADENVRLAGGFDPKLSSVGTSAFENDSNDDYDVPCGTSDDSLSHPDITDYDIPPTPVLCADVFSFPDHSSAFNVRRKKRNLTPDSLIGTDSAIQEATDVDYDTPRTVAAEYDISRHSPTPPTAECSNVDQQQQHSLQSSTVVTLKTDVTANNSEPKFADGRDHIVLTGTTSALNPISTPSPVDASISSNASNSNGPCCELPSCEKRLSVVNQFKAVRLDVLTAMSQLLKCVGCPEYAAETRLALVAQLCTTLKLSLLRFINFIQTINDGVEQTDDGILKHMHMLQSVHDGIDHCLEEVETLSTKSAENINAILAGIIHKTKGIPGLLRTFAPLVERAAVLVEEKWKQTESKPSENIVVNVNAELDVRVLNTNTETISKSETDDYRLSDCTSTNLVNACTVNRTLNKQDVDNQPHSKSNENDCQSFTGHDDPRKSDFSVVDVDAPSLPPKQKLKKSEIKENGDHKIDGQLISASDENCNETHKYNCTLSQMKSNSIEDQLSSVSEADTSDSPFSEHSHYQPVMRRKPLHHIEADDHMRISRSELETPDVRASGVSQTTVDQLEELRRQADLQHVQVHTESSLFNELDMSVNFSANQLSDNDRRILMFYCSQLTNNWTVLDNAAGAFFHCMERKQSPKAFVTHSKFVILAGHKMTYIGDIIAKHIVDENAQNYVVAYSNRLCDSLKMAVRATKDAALKFPDIQAQQLMVDSIKEVTDWALELKEVVDRLTYIGRPEQLLA